MRCSELLLPLLLASAILPLLLGSDALSWKLPMMLPSTAPLVLPPAPCVLVGLEDAGLTELLLFVGL